MQASKAKNTNAKNYPKINSCFLNRKLDKFELNYDLKWTGFSSIQDF